MKIKIKPQTKVASNPYKIVFNPYLHYDEGFVGSLAHRKQIIEIEPNLAPSRKIETLIHEGLHIVNDVYRCGLNEDDVCRMGEGITDFIMNTFEDLEFDWSEVKEK